MGLSGAPRLRYDEESEFFRRLAGTRRTESIRKGKAVKFNDNQREGLAKVADNLAAAAMVVIVASGIVEHKIGLSATAFLLCAFIVLLCIAFILRGKENKNDD